MKTYDIGIIGAGIAGCFAALRLAEKHKNLKVILFELGPPPPNWIRKDPIRVKRRRRQLEGWFGCFPTGDGKVYPADVQKVNQIADGRRVKSIEKWFNSHLDSVYKAKLSVQKPPTVAAQKRIKEQGFEIALHDYYQWYPNEIHQLSREIAEKIEKNGNISVMFDCEVFDFLKDKGIFKINTSDGEFEAKKLILGVGRSSWRWVNRQYERFGILNNSKFFQYGFRVEIPGQYMKEFNRSHCSMTDGYLSIGPLCWGGSVVQEDHSDVTIASFRSNEPRWHTDKVFFSLLTSAESENPRDQLDRISKLAFLLSGDRVGRERVKSFLKKDSANQLCLIPEYKWIKDSFSSIEKIFPNFGRGYLHTPDIVPMMANINVSSKLETDVEGLFVAGESANIMGIAAAGISGGIAAEGAA